MDHKNKIPSPQRGEGQGEGADNLHQDIPIPLDQEVSMTYFISLVKTHTNSLKSMISVFFDGGSRI